MDALGIIQQYGWFGFLIYVSLKEVWPFVADRVYPQRIKDLEIKRAVERAEVEWRHKLEERMVLAVEQNSQNIQSMALAITTNNERLAQLVMAHAKHDSFTISAVGEMKQAVMVMHQKEISDV